MSIKPIEIVATNSLGCRAKGVQAFFPNNIKQIGEICEQTEEELYPVGGLTNTLVLDGFKGKLLFSDNIRGMDFFETGVRVRAGEKIGHLACFAQINGLSGMENFFGLPGTVGGAVMGNAGCFGTSIADLVESCSLICLDTGEKKVLKKEETTFSYRESSFRKNKDFLYEVTLKLQPDVSEKIARKMSEIVRKRKETQPKERSLGCVFKNPQGVSAGYLIEKSGLKGKKVGDMKVSEKHGNFIVNCGNGSAEEYCELMHLIEKTIRNEWGIQLRREVNIFGEDRRSY